jgi:fructose-bisphosphate aldolase class II
MLTSLSAVLGEARKGRYAVPAFDCAEDVMVRTILETSEACRAPVILMGLVGPDLEGNGWAYVSGLVRAVADHHRVPAVLHLDHATRLEDIRRAVDLGFTSVMIDGSRLPFEGNAELTRAAVEIAHPRGISVEGELGAVGGSDVEEKQRTETVLTRPEEVRRFVAETGVDALAISIGTSHGLYRTLPRLDIARLRELDAASPVPLVLHGGSGTPDDQVREAVRNGITKMNVYAELRIAMAEGLKASAASQTCPDPLPREIFGPIRKSLAAVVERKIDLLGARGRA